MIYRRLAEAYGWTPDQVNRLTLFQLSVYLGGITPEHGRVSLSPAEAARYVEHCKRIK